MPVSTEAFELQTAAPESSNDAPLPSHELDRVAMGRALATVDCLASKHALHSRNRAGTLPD